MTGVATSTFLVSFPALLNDGVNVGARSSVMGGTSKYGLSVMAVSLVGLLSLTPGAHGGVENKSEIPTKSFTCEPRFRRPCVAFAKLDSQLPVFCFLGDVSVGG